MSQIRAGAIWCGVFFLAQAAICQCHGQVAIEWRLAEGSRWRLEMAQRIRTETRREGRADQVTLDTAMEMEWIVESVDAAGSMLVGQTFRRFRLKSGTPDSKSVDYDSMSSQEPPEAVKPIAKMMRPLIGIRYQLALSPRGEIIDVQLSAETESLLGQLPTMSRWKRMLTQDGMNRVLRQSLGVLPASATKIGDRWTSQHRVDSPLGQVSIQTTYRNDGPQRRGPRTLHKISAAIESTVAEVEGADSGRSRLQPKQQAVYYFDGALGCLAESRTVHSIRSEVPYGDAKIVVASEGVVTLRIIQIEKE